MQLSWTSFAAGAAVMVVLGAGSAVAATGGKLIIGHTNTATTTTTIKDTRGTPLSLKAPTSKAPLAVSNAKKVKHLNADYLDGISSGSFALRKGGTAEYLSTSRLATLTDSKGNPIGLLSAAKCPQGTVATGVTYWNGGNWPIEQSDLIDTDKDGVADAGAVLTSSVTATTTNFGAIVDCYNPHGKVPAQPGSSAAATTQARHAAMSRKLQSLAATALAR